MMTREEKKEIIADELIEVLAQHLEKRQFAD
jgi:shikimate kinase